MNRFPKNGWRRVQLGSLAEFRNGVNFSKENFGRGMKVIGVADFQSNVRASFDHLEEINPVGVVRPEHMLRNGDILFVRSNGNRDLIGRSMYVGDVPGEITHSAFSIRLRFTSPECNPRFYAYLFRSQLIRQALSLYGGGTNISNLNQEILGRLQVPVPPLATQGHIADVLAAYDDLIGNNTRRVEILEQMAQMLYREWFVNFRFPNDQKVRIAKAKGGLIPADWESTKLSSLINLERNGISPSHFESETFWHFSIPAFDQSHMPVKELGSTIKSNKFLIASGCILISKLNPRLRRIWIPDIRVSLRAIASTEFLVLKPRKPGSLPFVWQLLNCDDFQGQFLGLALGTSTSHQRVKPKDFLNLPILVPSAQLMERFCVLMQPVIEEIAILRRKTLLLRSTRDLLIPQLVSGEVSVEQIEAEVPAQTI